MEITVFKALSSSLGIPVWIYYAGVVLISASVFKGIWRGLHQSLQGEL